MVDSNYCFDVPAVRGIQAGRCYFSMTPPMGTLKRLIAFDTGNVLQRSQREVNKTRAKNISDYILDNKETYVLPSLAGVVDENMIQFIESDLSPNVGILRISMDADVFLFDGQHRSTGIIDAVSKDSDLRSHSTPIMLFSGMTLEDRQQAFADINGHTVKPSISISDTYNKRNDLPMLIVEMANSLPVFVNLVDFERNIIAKKSDYLFPVKILKDATMRLMGLKANSNLSDDAKEIIKQFWSASATPLLWVAFKNWDESADDFRQTYISSHGVFLNALGMFGSIVLAQYGNFDLLSNLSNLNIRRDSIAFKGRCIDAVTGNMLTDLTAIKLTAIKMLCHVGCPVPPELAALERKYFTDSELMEANSELVELT